MPVTIKNLTATMVYVALNSGDTLRLSPGQTSGEIQDSEVTNNLKVDKLKRQRMIAIVNLEGKAIPATESATAPETSSGGKWTPTPTEKEKPVLFEGDSIKGKAESNKENFDTN
jgi:DMSO/TMAO reductase YedYZ molybdopterin-dependent catalytic subunit